MAIPKSLISREMLSQIQGITSYRTTLLPTNTSGSYVPSGNNRVLFTIPAFENCMINTKRSYIHFKLKATGPNAGNAILTHGAPVFRRLMIKNSRGSVLSDIDNYDVYCRIMNNMKPLNELKGKSSVSYDNRAAGGVDYQEDFSTGKTVVHELMDGVLGKEQQFLIPVSSMLASSGHAFQIELWLSDPKNVFSSSKGDAANSIFSYELSDVAYELELVQLSPELMQDINTEIAGGQSIPIPYRSVKAYRNQVASGTSYRAQVTDFSQNVEAVYSVIRKQSAGSVITASVVDELTSRSTEIDPYRFMGGRFSVDKTNTLNASDVIVNRYSYKYGAKMYPLSPVALDNDSTLALENVISGFELDEKVPFIAEKISTTGKKVARFETDLFVLATNFKTTKDSNLVNGLNSASTGSPIELDVQFEAPIQNILIDTFVVSTQTLYIKMNGASSLTKD